MQAYISGCCPRVWCCVSNLNAEWIETVDIKQLNCRTIIIIIIIIAFRIIMSERTVHMECDAGGQRSTMQSPLTEKAFVTSYWIIEIDHVYTHPMLAKRSSSSTLPPLGKLLPIRLLRTAIDRKVIGADSVIYVAYTPCECEGKTRLRNLLDNVFTLFREPNHGKHMRVFALATTNKVEPQGESRCGHQVAGDLVDAVRSVTGTAEEWREAKSWRFTLLSEVEYNDHVKDYAEGKDPNIKIVPLLPGSDESDGAGGDSDSESDSDSSS